MNLAPCLAFTLKAEGGFVNNSSDPGGATNMGITLATLRQWRGTATVADVKALTVDTASAIYGTNYWNPVRGEDLPIGVDLMVFDMGVNAGCRTSIMRLQLAAGFIGADVDGWIGPATLARVRAYSAPTLILNISSQQLRYYQALAGWPTFGHGWTNRLNARRSAATGMLPAAPVVVAMPKLVVAELTADELNAQQIAAHDAG